ncbi:Machado-joseph disease protein MJD [Hesseltinella vesiculosa]|uniref:ubiquitinyl hydrolase 1 n=1 Tax=Hesseltinella vesiculosa TaxID=101127 RepID=A0A1X2GI77_9FUNG|nr:Machado-joseph disease protein MJD [Hesseltinella vesiculosa]
MDLVPDIFFEKQEGNLCAQHALNALLQGPYFTAIDLAEIGRDLDAKESIVHGRQVHGNNYDDSGYFSIQVIQRALSVWDLELVPWGSTDASSAREAPQDQLAYICHLDQHWFTLRKFAVPWRWYNLNSTQACPSYLSETYLGMLLQQIQSEGYSIFIVKGSLPGCSADERAVHMAPPSMQEKSKGATPFSGKGVRLSDTVGDNTHNEATSPSQPSLDEIRQKRLARFG